eukprot:191443-Chlamydomonas_euryale.AAC.3
MLLRVPHPAWLTEYLPMSICSDHATGVPGADRSIAGQLPMPGRHVQPPFAMLVGVGAYTLVSGLHTDPNGWRSVKHEYLQAYAQGGGGNARACTCAHACSSHISQWLSKCAVQPPSDASEPRIG